MGLETIWVGVMARPSEPTALKLVKGTRDDRVNRLEPAPIGDVVAPVELGGKALEVWERLAPDMIRLGVLTPWDTDHFAAYCRWVVVEMNALDVVDRDGAMIPGERGLVKNPAMQIARDAGARMTAIGSRFGMTPSDRAKLSVGEVERDDAERLLT